jgi:proline iminopeptidase
VWYRIIGTGEKIPLICLHGGPGGRSCRLSTLADLGNERPVILYDQLGSGRSDHPSDTSLWHIERFVEELEALRKHLNLQEFHLFGLSWGTAVAIEYILTNRPKGLRSVILAGPFLSTKIWLRDAQILLSELPDSIRTIFRRHEEEGTTSSTEYQNACEEYYNRFLYRKHPYLPPPECEGTTSNDSVYNFMWGPSEFTASGNLKGYDLTDRLQELTLPVLLLVGEFDEARPETMKEFQRRIPKSELIVIPDAAHLAIADQPELYIKTLRDFLRRVESHQ